MEESAEEEGNMIRGLIGSLKSANFDCIYQHQNLPFGQPTTFGGDFVPKGNINFVFVTGTNSNNSNVMLGTPYLYIIQQLSWRLQNK